MTVSPFGKKPRGFALVATPSIMVLLVILALGTLSLSSVAIRSVSLDSSNAEARVDARMALMPALDRIQSKLGLDQRVTAGALFLSDSPLAWVDDFEDLVIDRKLHSHFHRINLLCNYKRFNHSPFVIP